MTGEVGQIKVAYLCDKTDILKSQMFDDLQSALKFIKDGCHREVLVFQRLCNDARNYEWKLLPYGDYSKYTTAMFIERNWFALLLLIIGIIIIFQ